MRTARAGAKYASAAMKGVILLSVLGLGSNPGFAQEERTAPEGTAAQRLDELKREPTMSVTHRHASWKHRICDGWLHAKVSAVSQFAFPKTASAENIIQGSFVCFCSIVVAFRLVLAFCRFVAEKGPCVERFPNLTVAKFLLKQQLDKSFDVPLKTERIHKACVTFLHHEMGLIEHDFIYPQGRLNAMMFVPAATATSAAQLSSTFSSD